MPTGRHPVILILALAALLAACPSTPEKAPPPKEEPPPATGTQDPDDGGSVVVHEKDGLTLYAPDTGSTFFEDLQVFFGGDRPPGRALAVIRETHNLKTWTYRTEVEDAVDRTREAIENLTRSDYGSWDEKALVISVLSTMAMRDPASVVRTDCLSTLLWFRDRVHEDAIRLDPPIETDEDDIIKALKALDSLKGDASATGDPKKVRLLLTAIEILGSHPWDRLASDRPAIVRSSLSRPRGVVRRLSRPDLTSRRTQPEIAAGLDRALIRVADEVIILTMMAALADTTAYVRADAAKALAEARDSRSVGTIIEALRAESRDFVTQELVRALGRCTRDEDVRRTVPALADLLMDTDITVRQAAARELDRLTDAGFGVDPAAWLRWWKVNAKDYGRR